jgi:hypothetical protein
MSLAFGDAVPARPRDDNLPPAVSAKAFQNAQSRDVAQ